MDGLGDGGIRELGLLRKRVRRLYGLGRLSRIRHDELQSRLTELEVLFNAYDDKTEEANVGTADKAG